VLCLSSFSWRKKARAFYCPAPAGLCPQVSNI
jgi:hypothetical protein